MNWITELLKYYLYKEKLESPAHFCAQLPFLKTPDEEMGSQIKRYRNSMNILKTGLGLSHFKCSARNNQSAYTEEMAPFHIILLPLKLNYPTSNSQNSSPLGYSSKNVYKSQRGEA